MLFVLKARVEYSRYPMMGPRFCMSMRWFDSVSCSSNALSTVVRTGLSQHMKW